MKVEVIRIIRYVGEEESVRAALSKSLPDGIKEAGTYQIEVATHSSNLSPVVKLDPEQVIETLFKHRPRIDDLRVEYKRPAYAEYAVDGCNITVVGGGNNG